MKGHFQLRRSQVGLTLFLGLAVVLALGLLAITSQFSHGPTTVSADPPATNTPIDGATMEISAKALTSHECNATQWQFVITQIDTEADAPASITVTFANGDVVTVALSSFTGGTAHYITTSDLDSTVVSATAQIYDAWSGEFNLSDGPCPGTATPTATETPVTPTDTPTATNTPVTPTDTPTATETPLGSGGTDTPTPTNTPVTPTHTPRATETPETPTHTPRATETPETEVNTSTPTATSTPLGQVLPSVVTPTSTPRAQVLPSTIAPTGDAGPGQSPLRIAIMGLLVALAGVILLLSGLKLATRRHDGG